MKNWLMYWSPENSGEEEVMPSIFQGRPILPGSAVGEAVVSRQGFNAYACFYDCLGENATLAICAHAGNSGLYGKQLSGKIICLPTTTGSTSAGAAWMRVAQLGIAPKAMLFTNPIDSLTAGGLLAADIWTNARILTIDRLGEEFLSTVNTGDHVQITEDGQVRIMPEKSGADY
jgi:predicted aconitase with swiveling domain